jgi:hypothetical protein
MFWRDADQLRKHALRAAFVALICIGFGNTCFAQSEPPLTVGRAGALPGPSSGCDPLAGGNAGFYGTSGTGTTSANAKSPAGNDNFGGNVPLYGTDLNGNFPLYSTPDLGGNAPLYSTLTPGINAPLFSDPSFGNYSNRGTNSGAGSGVSSAVNAGPTRCRSAIPVGEWLLYPSLRAYSLYSDNLFLAPTAPTKVLGFGTTPSLTAQWTNGIHTTTIFGNIDTQYYPTNTIINTFDREATITQKYAPLPDLTFTAVGDYTHKTIGSALTNSIPTTVNTPVATPTLLPNGNIELPNGNIVAPNGQILGQVNPALANSGTTIVNPYDQYTATGSVSKIFNGASLTLSSSVASTDYQLTQGTGPTSFTSFTTESFTEGSSIALGPLFYAYSNGSFSMRNENTSVDANSDAYRVVGGIGTRQFGLFRASGYFGHQGSDVEGSGTAGGNVYGGTVSYYPTLVWTIIARFDQTDNISSQSVASTQALALPTNSPVQIPLSSSTFISTPSLQTTYQISPKWTFLGDFTYSHIEYIGSPALTDAWFASATLSYEIWRNMTLTGQYQFANIVSNVAGESAQRNLVMLSADYRF